MHINVLVGRGIGEEEGGDTGTKEGIRSFKQGAGMEPRVQEEGGCCR